MFGRLKIMVFSFIVGVGVGTFGVAKAETSCSEGWDGARQCISGVRSQLLEQSVAKVGGQRAS